MVEEVQGRDEAATRKAFDALSPAQKNQVEAVAADFWEPYRSVYRLVSRGEDYSKAAFIFSPCILLVIWFFLPPTQVTLNRLGGAVHFRQGKRKYDFPWDQISFKHQWIPTKTGGSTLFTLIALPPYPEALHRLIETKARPAPGQVFTFQLGSFDVKGPEHGQAFFAFLDTWMRSRDPAANVYEGLVGRRFGT